MNAADKAKIIDNYEAIVTDLHVDDVLSCLIQHRAVSIDDVDIIRHQDCRKSKVEKLIEFLLTKGTNTFSAFCNALEQPSYMHLLRLLQHEPSDILLISNELKEFYHRTLCRLSPIPWCEWFQVNLDGIYTSLCLVRAIQRRAFQLDAAKSSYVYNITPADLFSSTSESAAPQRILIEGEPGIGKSTLCCKIIYDWSTPTGRINDQQPCKESLACIQKFDLVFALKAWMLQPDETIIDAVMRQLFPDDYRLSAGAVLSCIEANQSRTLFIIDGYDELRSEHKDLVRLIGRKILRHCTVIIASRPAVTISLVSHFDALYVVTGYDQERSIEFIDNYARETSVTGVRPDRFERLKDLLASETSVGDLCRNPLNLSILCMLFDESDPELPKTRTKLFCELLNFGVEKASRQLDISKNEFQSVVMPDVYKMSAKALSENRYYFREEDLTASVTTRILDRLGFFTREVKLCRMTSQTTYVINHKNYLEFFVAKHLENISLAECVSYLSAAIAHKSLHTVCSFLFGLCADREDVQTAFLQMLATETFFPTHKFHQTGYYNIAENHRLHLIFRCLCELEKPLGESLRQFLLQITPRQVYFSNPYCTSTCINGFLKACGYINNHFKLVGTIPPSPSKLLLCGSEDHPSDFVTTPSSSTETNAVYEAAVPADYIESWGTQLTEMTRLTVISCISIYNISSVSTVARSLSLLKVGHHDSKCRRLKLCFVPIHDAAVDHPFEPFGRRIKQLSLYNCPCSEFLQQCLEALPEDCSLEHLAISVSMCKVSASCGQVLSRRLQTLSSLETFCFLSHTLDVDDPEMMLEIICSLSCCRKLRVVKLSSLPSLHLHANGNMDANVEHQSKLLSAFTDILALPCLEDLSLGETHVSSDVLKILAEQLQSNTRLQHLQLRRLFPSRPPGINQLLSVLPTMSCLCELRIKYTELSEQDYTLIGELVARSTTLTSLTISPLNSSMVEPISAGLRENRSLISLRLFDVGFANWSVRGFAVAVRDHPRLQRLELSLHPGNYLTGTMIEHLFSALEAHVGLTQLAVRQFGLEDDHMKLVGEVVAKNKTITRLDLSDNRISSVGVQYLAEYLTVRDKLDLLDLSDCLVTKSDDSVRSLRLLARYLKVNWF